MTTSVLGDTDRLYKLLPSTYREADAAQGEPLRGLMRLVGEQASVLKSDIGGLWDDFFIDTCHRWVIPYIGELVSNNLLHDIDLAPSAATAEELFLGQPLAESFLLGPNLRPTSAIRTRADVAKTIYYRRRKGTLPMLEELARDVTGWAAHAVEFFEKLVWTQNLNHLRLNSTGCPDLRRVDVGDRVPGPFDETSHIADVRRIDQAEGWYNLRNIGFFLWRLRSYPIERAAAQAIAGTNWRFTFSPLGNNAPLFSPWRREGDETGLATEIFVPASIRPPAFFEDLSRLNATTPIPNRSDHYADPAQFADWSFAVFENGVLVPAKNIACANLRTWLAAQPNDDKIRVDVARGRLTVGQLRAPATITASFHYGFSADLGGGPYDRAKWLVRPEAAQALLRVGGAAPTQATLDLALAAWALHPERNTLITIHGNDTHPITNALTLHPSAWLAIQADNGTRPHVQPAGGAIEVNGAGKGSQLTLSGLLVEGGVKVKQDIQSLRLLHTTLVPGRSIEEDAVAPPAGGPALLVSKGTVAGPRNRHLRVEIAFSITGPLRIPSESEGLWLLDSIVDGTRKKGSPRVAAIAAPAGKDGPRATIERSTILGASFFHKFPLGSESIFTDVVTVLEQQEGCVRFSFVPSGSVTPRRYRCQPALEIETENNAKRDDALKNGIVLPPGWEKDLADRIDAWMAPSFTAVDYGHPGYVQVRLATPIQIRTGAEDGSEMGAFCHLKQPQRETNLRIRLDEYLPFGLTPGLIYVT
jgi:hypothetical protein